MNETITPFGATNASRPTADQRLVPNTSMLPTSEKAPPPAVGLLRSSVRRSPLACIAATLSLGALIAHMSRRTHRI